MDMKQIVEIPLEEYLELKALADHEKMVKITDESHHLANGTTLSHASTGVEWKSDGAVWNRLTFRLKNQGIRSRNTYNGIVTFIEAFRDMKIPEVLKLRSEFRKTEDIKEIIIKHFPGWEG